MNGFFIVIAVVVPGRVGRRRPAGCGPPPRHRLGHRFAVARVDQSDHAARKEVVGDGPDRTVGPGGRALRRPRASWRGDLEPVAAATPAVFVPPDPEAYDVSGASSSTVASSP